MASRVRILAAIGWLAVLAGCAHVDRDREVLDSLEIEGNESLSASEIEERLALAETPVWPWSDAQYFDAGTLVGDRRRLLRFYQANGFYDARVRSRLKREAGEVDLTFIVEEGPATRVRRIEIRGLEALPASQRQSLLRTPLPLREGDRIREEAYDQSLAELSRRLREAGYGDAEVTGSVSVSADDRVADVSIEATPGRRLRWGKVVVTGAVDVPRETISEAVRRSLPENKPYSDESLDEAQTSVFDLGVFGGVRVSRGPSNPDDPADDKVPVLVSVREAPFQTIRLGGGVALNQQRSEARAIGEYTHRNFLGGLRVLRWENRLGYAAIGEMLDQEVSVHGLVGSSALDFTQPRLLPQLDGNLRLEYERGLEESFQFDAVRGRVGFPVRLHRSLTFTPSYNLQLFLLESNLGDATSPNDNCQSEQGQCVLSFVEERLAWDRRDNPVEATKGWYAAVALQQGGGFLGGKSDFDRALAEVRWYQRLPWNTVLALRVEGGLLDPRAEGGSPIMQRFYGGGGSGNRAFSTRRLSPQKLKEDRVLVDPDRVVEDGRLRALDASDTSPIGGDALVEGSAELRIPLVGDLGMAAFVDAGNVAPSFAEAVKPNVGVGLGIRYRTPFGPVRLDAGYRIVSNLPPLVDTGIDGAVVPDPPFALHFGIGESF